MGARLIENVARAAGLFYFLSVAAAVLGEFVFPHKLGAAAVVVPIACYAFATLFLLGVFRAVDTMLATLAACLQFVGLAFEAFQFQPRGLNFALVFHGLFCLVMGYLILRATFMPRVLGALIAIAGLIWLVYLSPALAGRIAPYNTAVGLLCEGLPMLWLLAAGVNAERWREQARAMHSG
jgi:Domain of unknown function (DUF4386)